MFKPKYKWNILKNELWLDKPALLRGLLENRKIGIDDESLFLEGEKPLYSPFLFRDMDKSVQRIKKAVENGESVLIYGDYDVDGVTGTTILVKILKKLGLESVSYYIPNRFSEGYGPNLDAFKRFVDQGITLVITVDNGITGVEECAFANEHGMDVIITDHHNPKEVLPMATAIIHPKLEGETYPFDDLSGCGVAFKLAWALNGSIPYDLIDLAALGTFADIVSSIDENRTILKRGLQQLKQTTHIGLVAMAEIAKIDEINETALGFMYGPRLNAPGRLTTANDAVKLLLCEDREEAIMLALEIEELNQSRKSMIEDIVGEAHEMIEREGYTSDPVLVIAGDDWHEGVLGIVASRLVDHYGKPAIVLTQTEVGYKGSARTLPDFSLFDNLNQLSHLFLKFGGHKMAAGLSLIKENVPILRRLIQEHVAEELIPTIDVDGLLTPSLVDTSLIELCETLRPYGPGNHQPLFVFQDVELVDLLPIGKDGKHIKFQIRQNGFSISCIAFGFGHLLSQMSTYDTISVVGSLDTNTYLGKTTIQIKVKDILCAHRQFFDYRNRQNRPLDIEPIVAQKVYFTSDHNIKDAVLFEDVLNFESHVLLIDVPNTTTELKTIMKSPDVTHVTLLLKGDDLFSTMHLMTREKMIKIYTTYKRFIAFQMDDKRVINELVRLGFNKNIHYLAIQVFFELNFVIIEDKYIKIVEKPDKKELLDSPTFTELLESIEMKEKLTLLPTIELKQYLQNI